MQARFNDLVREAFIAQEAFDNWDRGVTYLSGPFGGRRACTLDEVVAELDAANLKLATFAYENYQTLKGELHGQSRKV